MRHVRRHSRVGLARIGARVRNMLANRRRPLGDLRPGDLRRLCRLRRLGIGFIDVVRRQIAELLLPLQACGCRREVGHVRINDSVRFVAGLFESGFRSPQIRQRSNVVSIGARQHTIGEATALVEVFLNTGFSGESRHSRRLAMVSDFEETGTPPAVPQSEQP